MDNMDFEAMDPEDISLEELFGDNLIEELDFLKETVEEPAVEVENELLRSVTNKREEKPSWQNAVILYLHDLVFLLAGVILVFLLCFRVVVVSGTSMNNTLLDGDYLLLIGDMFYRDPQQGDVIVASKESFDDGAPIVKRVIATAGQTVDIDFNNGIVYVDDIPLDEPYTLTLTNLYEGVSFPQVVQQGCIFVMGDNRNDSKDSRNPQIGQIDCREVLGKVVFLFLPGTNDGEYLRDFNRIGVVS